MESRNETRNVITGPGQYRTADGTKVVIKSHSDLNAPYVWEGCLEGAWRGAGRLWTSSGRSINENSHGRTEDVLDRYEISRSCTCHPDDKPPVPCPQKYALGDCQDAAKKTRNPDLAGMFKDRVTTAVLGCLYDALVELRDGKLPVKVMPIGALTQEQSDHYWRTEELARR